MGYRKMSNEITVDIKDHIINDVKNGLKIKKRLDLSKVFVTQGSQRRHWGYVWDHPKGGKFQPLSGFPTELVPEVQKQINGIRGFAEGSGPAPPVMVRQGGTAQQQREEAEDTDE